MKQGRIFTELSWNYYGGESVVFRHPTMQPEEMFALNGEVQKKGYSTGRILGRTFQTLKNCGSLVVGISSFFTQVGMRKWFRTLYEP